MIFIVRDLKIKWFDKLSQNIWTTILPITSGPCWRHLIGSTYLYGIVNDKGEFSGDNIAFIYQDITHALIGKFNKGIMVRFLKRYLTPPTYLLT